MEEFRDQPRHMDTLVPTWAAGALLDQLYITVLQLTAYEGPLNLAVELDLQPICHIFICLRLGNEDRVLRYVLYYFKRGGTCWILIIHLI